MISEFWESPEVGLLNGPHHFVGKLNSALVLCLVLGFRFLLLLVGSSPRGFCVLSLSFSFKFLPGLNDKSLLLIVKSRSPASYSHSFLLLILFKKAFYRAHYF